MINTGKEEVKLSLLDMIVYGENPEDQQQKTIRISELCKVIGYKVNTIIK